MKFSTLNTSVIGLFMRLCCSHMLSSIRIGSVISSGFSRVKLKELCILKMSISTAVRFKGISRSSLNAVTSYINKNIVKYCARTPDDHTKSIGAKYISMSIY